MRRTVSAEGLRATSVERARRQVEPPTGDAAAAGLGAVRGRRPARARGRAAPGADRPVGRAARPSSSWPVRSSTAKLGDAAIEVVATAAGSRWSSAGDFVDAVEQLGSARLRHRRREARRADRARGRAVPVRPGGLRRPRAARRDHQPPGPGSSTARRSSGPCSRARRRRRRSRWRCTPSPPGTGRSSWPSRTTRSSPPTGSNASWRCRPVGGRADRRPARPAGGGAGHASTTARSSSTSWSTPRSSAASGSSSATTSSTAPSPARLDEAPGDHRMNGCTPLGTTDDTRVVAPRAPREQVEHHGGAHDPSGRDPGRAAAIRLRLPAGDRELAKRSARSPRPATASRASRACRRRWPTSCWSSKTARSASR